jgi:hypothetical protein
MIYDAETRELMTNDRKLLKKLDCPLHKKWQDLTMISEELTHRHCSSCKKNVVDIGEMTDEEAMAFFEENPESCVYLGAGYENMRHRLRFWQEEPAAPKPCVCREIQTARGEKAINAAVANGYFPLLKQVEMSVKLIRRMSVYQHIETGEVDVSLASDRRRGHRIQSNEWGRALLSFPFYPNPPQEPFAAYLLPKDLMINETVFLTDLIDDFIAFSHGAEHFRLKSAYAVWTGKDFEVLWDEEKDAGSFIG